jgi:hypothetical protein
MKTKPVFALLLWSAVPAVAQTALELEQKEKLRISNYKDLGVLILVASPQLVYVIVGPPVVDVLCPLLIEHVTERVATSDRSPGCRRKIVVVPT